MAHKKLQGLIDQDNIADGLDKKELISIGKRVYDDWFEDESSRREWVERTTKAMEIATQVWKTKSFPWPNAANVRYPLMTIAAMNFHARSYPVLIPYKQLVTARVTGADPEGEKREAALRINEHMTWQLMEEMIGWEEGMDRLLITLPLTGSEFKKTYFDPQKGHNVSEYVSSFDLVVNYWSKDLESASRKTHMIPMTLNEIMEMQAAGLYSNIVLDDPVPRDDLFTYTREKSQGMRMPSKDDDYPYSILEWHGFLDLDEDGYKEPYIVTIEIPSQKVLRIVARYEAGDIEYSGDKLIRIIPQEYFTHYRFIPSPDGGFYGMAFGNLLGPLNAAVDTLINQLVDAGTLANMPSGFISRSLRLQGGNYRFKPGEWKWVNATGQDLGSSIVPLPAPDPSTVLFQLLGMLIDSGQRLTSTTDIMVGENPGQNQKATTTMAVVENGMKVFTAIYKRIRRSLGDEFKKLFRLNEKYVDFQGYWSIVDRGYQSQPYQQEMTDYQMADLDITPSADPSAVSQMQKQARAQVLLELLPMGMLNPQVVMARVLEAMEIERPEELMNMPPPPPDPEVVLKDRELDIKEQDNLANQYLEALKIEEGEEERAADIQLQLLKIQEKKEDMKLAKVKGDADVKRAGAQEKLARVKGVAAKSTNKKTRSSSK